MPVFLSVLVSVAGEVLSSCDSTIFDAITECPPPSRDGAMLILILVSSIPPRCSTPLHSLTWPFLLDDPNTRHFISLSAACLCLGWPISNLFARPHNKEKVAIFSHISSVQPFVSAARRWMIFPLLNLFDVYSFCYRLCSSLPLSSKQMNRTVCIGIVDNHGPLVLLFLYLQSQLYLPIVRHNALLFPVPHQTLSTRF